MKAFCSCGSKEPLHEAGNRKAICDSCGTVYFLQVLNADPSAQAVGFIITLLMAAFAAGLGLGVVFLWTH